MKIEVTQIELGEVDADLLAVGLLEDGSLPAELAEATGAAGAKGAYKRISTVFAGEARVLIAGLGKREELDAERLRVEEGLRGIGLRTSETQANFSWVDLGAADEAEVLAGLAARQIAVRPGAALGEPGHVRVSYGTPAEDDRFLAAIAELASA